jgi:hydrogenase/urease accessory protein HupE
VSESSLVRAALLFLIVSWLALPAHGHPTPFSYLDLHIKADQIEGELVVHVIDLAHDLNVTPPELLLDPGLSQSKRDEIQELLKSRLVLAADGQPVEPELVRLEPLPDRQALSLELRLKVNAFPGVLRIACSLFPDDQLHQTFLNIYQDERLVHQEIFSRDHRTSAYFAGGQQGSLAVVKRFLPAGIYHIFTGPDHVLFIIGLLLLGGSLLRLLSIVTAFTVAHSITLSLAAMDLVNPPPQLIEPAIALSIVYVGIDNLMVGKSGRDMRAWIASFFGLVHGFGFAAVLREFGLPRASLGWSLFSFNFGVEIGQACIVVVVASLLAALRRRDELVGTRVVKFGSVGVSLAGGYWFIERVFF